MKKTSLVFSILAMTLVACGGASFEAADVDASDVDALKVDTAITETDAGADGVDAYADAAAETPSDANCTPTTPGHLVINEIHFETYEPNKPATDSYVEIMNIGECPVTWFHDLTWRNDTGIYVMTFNNNAHPVIPPGGRIIIGTANYSNSGCQWLEMYKSAYPYGAGEFRLMRGLNELTDWVFVVPINYAEDTNAARLPASFDRVLARWPDGNNLSINCKDIKEAPPSPCAKNVAPN